MQTLRHRARSSSSIIALGCMLVAGCAQHPPMASALRADAVVWNASAGAVYDSQPARDDAIAAGSVESRSAEADRFVRVEEMLATRVPALEVIRRMDGQLSIRVRGLGSPHGSGEPLLVVDGMSLNAGASEALAGLSAFDVRHVEVLKGPIATAIYGTRATNGVIVISTRRPR